MCIPAKTKPESTEVRVAHPNEDQLIPVTSSSELCPTTRPKAAPIQADRRVDHPS